ncbi:MAG: S9 family peptidase [bacterium]|nr:S9 family peptidase [bacterium]
MDKDKYTIADFLKVKTAFGPRFNPDASKIAYLSNLTGTTQIYLMSIDGSDVIQLTDFPDFISGMVFSPKENLIAFSKSVGGNEKNQLYLINPANKEIIELTNKPDTKYRLSSFSYDGEYISYASNERNGKDFDVYILNLETRKESCVFDFGDSCSSAGFSPSGKYLAVNRFYSNENNDLYLCNLETNKVEHLTPHDGNVSYGTPRWLPDESSFYLTMNKDVEFESLAKYSLKDKQFEYVIKSNWDIAGLAMQRNGKYFGIATNENGYSKLTIYEPYTLAPMSYNLPAGEIGSFSFSMDGKYLSFSLGDSRRTSNIFIANMETGETKQLINAPQGIPPDTLVEPELIQFKSFDGLEIPAFIYKPKNIVSGKKLPTIINIHGGPESQYRPGLALLTQYFVYAGYIVIAPNIRGSSGYGKTYMALDNVEKRMDSVKDIIALSEYLKNVSEVDINKLIVMGGSYGGFMVLACMAFYPDLWAAGVNTCGIVNFISFLENTAPYRRASREAEYGSLEKDREFLKSISPINSLDKIKAPLLVIHGANDPRVPLSEAEQIETKLKEHGRYIELLVYQDEGHGLSKLKNRLDAYPKVVEFLEKVLAK